MTARSNSRPSSWSGRRDDPDQTGGDQRWGFFGANAAHPFENPSAWTNFLTCLGMMLFPSTLVLMFGRMLRKMRHAVVIYGVMGCC